MTKEELKNATGQELIEQRDYCGVDSYYSDYLDSVNAEMLKRFNHLIELEKKNEELKEENEHIRRLLGTAIIVLNRIENPEVPYEKVVDNLRKLKELLGSVE